MECSVVRCDTFLCGRLCSMDMHASERMRLRQMFAHGVNSHCNVACEFVYVETFLWSCGVLVEMM